MRRFCRWRVLARRILSIPEHPVGLGDDYNHVMLGRQTISRGNAETHMDGSRRTSTAPRRMNPADIDASSGLTDTPNRG
jgi:hypothetical protein